MTALLIVLSFWLVLEHSLQKGLARSLQNQETSDAVLLHALEDTVVRSFQAINASLATISESLPLLGDEQNITRILSDQLRTAPQLRAVDLIRLDQTVIASATGYQYEDGSKGILCVQPLLENNLIEFVIGDPQEGRYPGDLFGARTGLHYVPFCFPVRSESGELVSVLVASINPQYFTNLFQSVIDANQSKIRLHRYDGLTLMGSDAVAASETLLARVKQRSWGAYRVAEGSDDAALLSYRSTSLLPLIISMESSEAFSLDAWRKDERMLSMVMMVLIALVTAIALVFVILFEKRDLAQGDIHLLSTAIRSAANAIFITNKAGKIHWVNDAFCRLTGYEFSEIKDKTPKFLNSGQHSPQFFKELWQTILNGESWRGELHNRHKSGERLTVEQTITPILNIKGDVEHFVAVHEDVTARKHAEEKALYLAGHDPLTGLPNRRHFEQRIHHVFEAPAPEVAGILFIDLDRFKEINDTMGHEAGDSLLSRTTERLVQLLGDQYLLARLGGDEFAILAYPVLNDIELSNLASQVIETVATPFEYGEAVFTVTCSVGIAQSFVNSGCDASSLLRQADMAMYRAKHEGKNTYRFFDEAMDALMKRRVYLQQQLDIAVKSDHELSLRFQPQVDSFTGQVCGAESLLRWETEEGEWISPAEFIGIAEETGQILEVGNWLMESLFRQMADWNARHVPFGKIAMNVSAVQLARDTLADRLLSLMRAFEIPPEQLSIEITETTLMATSDLVELNLKQLKQAGVTLAIDDFGTGYSSLSYLKSLNADYLKIDRSFVIGIGKNRSDESIIEATIALAKSLELATVAEGVDSEEQLVFLQQRHCNFIQGYLFAKPLLAEEFEVFMSSGASLRTGLDTTMETTK
ncbi:PAS domain S-box-containing protein/diguanylate cyclase (GGDEF) domain-containing protein [Oceanospirillum multiglobuliferum]|nr:PAS domain S-box-containing protein/diguanylate cyclase (GGDEF) domain-containing protein [Oceanospirillum multiglobuliferum]